MKSVTLVFVRFVYDTWYGAFVVFLSVSVLLLGLQMANCCLGDVMPWPKGFHALAMVASALNVGVAAIVSFFVQRKSGRALGQVAMLGASFFSSMFLAVFVWCVPTRMSAPPGNGWGCASIIAKTDVAKDKLRFLGGISAREPVAVYEVVDCAIDERQFFPGSPWTCLSTVEAIAHIRRTLDFCRVDVSLPDDAVLSHCDDTSDKDCTMITLIKAGDKSYFVCERL